MSDTIAIPATILLAVLLYIVGVALVATWADGGEDE